LATPKTTDEADAMNIVILAAGTGKRMRSALPKVLHPLAGRPLLSHVLDVARSLDPTRLVVVIGHGADKVQSAVGAPDVQFAVQEQQLGTGHAVQQALPLLDPRFPRWSCTATSRSRARAPSNA
jgi:bifunctional UDP-N-acetylglucosamine pyrophosphorylase/glucosamine-1-phosphate N-acetyltransferase